MKNVSRPLLALLVGALLAGTAAASGVGARLYIAGTNVTPASCEQPAPGAACNTCNSCQRLGFACVDHATPAPCTAEGGCYPARNTFGWHQTHWRRWPGVDYGGPGPERADERNALDVIDPPAAEDEDQQAPPPIEDPSKEATDSPNGENGPAPRPGLELELPPLPAAPSAPAGNQPALPFGALPPTQSAPASDGWGPPEPPFQSRPVSLPQMEAEDAPPALPPGFTHRSPEALIRRLPNTLLTPRYDSAIRQASATQPVR